jgi:hypothetical protein
VTTGPHHRLAVRASVLAPLVLVTLVFVVAVAATMTWDPSFDPATFAFIAVCVLWGAVQAAVGTIIAWRRPENRIGRLLQASGVLVAAAFVGYFVAAIRMESSSATDPMGGVAGWWASTTLFLAIYTAFPLLGLLFPDGHLPGPRWRGPVVAMTLAILACCAVFAVANGPLGPGLPDNPFGIVDVPAAAWQAANLVGTLLLVAAMALAAVAVLVRWRRGGRQARSQLKWLASAIVVAAILFTITFGGADEETTSPLAIVGVGSASLIPLAIGVAVLRYRLYEIDRIISRTIGWALVSGLLALVFGASILLLQGVLNDVTQGDTLAVAASTLLAAAAFQPLRRRVQDVVDRRFNRGRVDAQRAVDRFGVRVRDEVDLARLRSVVRAAAVAAVEPDNAAVWLRGRAR